MVKETLITAVSIVAVFGMIIFGVSSCNEGEQRLRSECIKAGGAVIPMGDKSACITKGMVQ